MREGEKMDETNPLSSSAREPRRSDPELRKFAKFVFVIMVQYSRVEFLDCSGGQVDVPEQRAMEIEFRKRKC